MGTHLQMSNQQNINLFKMSNYISDIVLIFSVVHNMLCVSVKTQLLRESEWCCNTAGKKPEQVADKIRLLSGNHTVKTGESFTLSTTQITAHKTIKIVSYIRAYGNRIF